MKLVMFHISSDSWDPQCITCPLSMCYAAGHTVNNIRQHCPNMSDWQWCTELLLHNHSTSHRVRRQREKKKSAFEVISGKVCLFIQSLFIMSHLDCKWNRERERERKWEKNREREKLMRTGYRRDPKCVPKWDEWPPNVTYHAAHCGLWIESKSLLFWKNSLESRLASLASLWHPTVCFWMQSGALESA